MAEQQQTMKQQHEQILVEHQKTIASLQALAQESERKRLESELAIGNL